MARVRHVLAIGLTLGAGLAVTACGGGSSHHDTSSAARSHAARRILPSVPAAIPTPAPTHRRASAAAVAVIRGWSDALRAGHVVAAARYFQLPSELINGAATNGTLALIRIHTLEQAEAANETLPCGAKFVSADQRGQYVNALFRLTGRPGAGGGTCGGTSGVTARTNFIISGGHIVEWIRAPDDPGDNGSAGRAPGGPAPTTPAPPGGPSGTSTGPVI